MAQQFFDHIQLKAMRQAIDGILAEPREGAPLDKNAIASLIFSLASGNEVFETEALIRLAKEHLQRRADDPAISSSV